jgi:hypothetical protein
MCGGEEVSILFTIKCLLKDYPITLIIAFTIKITFLLAVMTQIAEHGTIIDSINTSKHVDNRFVSFEDTLWFIYITYTTVGFGDLYPKTSLGRIIALATSLIGSFALSILVIMMDRQFLLNSKEKKVKMFLIKILEFVDRVYRKDAIKFEAANYISVFFKYFRYKKEIVNELDKSLPNASFVKKKVGAIKNTVYDKLDYKKKFKRFIQYNFSYILAFLEMCIIYLMILIRLIQKLWNLAADCKG